MPRVDLAAIVASLRVNAQVVAAQVFGVDEAQSRWKPEPAKWSILEVVTHLADEEVEDFRRRVGLTLRSPEAEWPPIDPPGWAVERRYNEGSVEEALGRFLRERAASVAFLAGLDDPDWAQAHHHPRWGPIRAGDLLTSWVAHDHIHIRQLNRLQREFLVASVSGYSPDYAGPW
jgi:hypothetical protein